MESESLPNTTMTWKLHAWGGGIHKLPEEFDFPRVDVISAWKLWWLGNKQLGHPPHKSIATFKLSSRKKQKAYSTGKC
ncbi:TPA: hypothetical protein N0F65_008883 [Lagenidium giganteum]|uniref:Uncharacterized protein n=1 Tax=Lagenidium giganteum TaxID=4803 RepID=A0AAV2YUE0_9STRA|nr:TPA: hypothetical protein N0F65_008883 [Lagenidium giganteum]